MIYFDVTDLLFHFSRAPRASGLQRVSLAFLSAIAETGRGDEIRLLALHPRAKELRARPLDGFCWDEASGPAFCAHFGVGYRGEQPIDAYVRERYRGGSRRFHKLRLIAENWLTGGRAFRRKGIDSCEHIPSAPWTAPEFAPGDTVLISGGVFGTRKLLPALARARNQNPLRLAQFVHDALPASHPQFFAPGHPRRFADWLCEANACVDVFITTSDRNSEALTEALAALGKTARPTRAARLAHEFRRAPASRPLHERVSSAALVAAHRPFALCVGTREIRKNGLALLRVWEHLAKQRPLDLPRLVFAGRPGWLNEGFDDFLARRPRLRDDIVLLEQASDHDLAHLYQSCLFSLFPSYAEGWGLPIGESLWFGRPVIASDTPASREVGGIGALYVAPDDLQALARAVEDLLDPIARAQREAAIPAMDLRSWSDFAGDLLNALETP